MIDIYCENNLCPICESQMDEKPDFDGFVLYCKNNCYKIEKDKYRDADFENHYVYASYVFGERVAKFRSNSPSLKKLEDAVLQHILYWKQDERYIMKILARG